MRVSLMSNIYQGDAGISLFYSLQPKSIKQDAPVFLYLKPEIIKSDNFILLN